MNDRAVPLTADLLVPGLVFQGGPLPEGSIPSESIIVVKVLHPDQPRPGWHIRWTSGVSVVDMLGAGELIAEYQRAAIRRDAGG